MCVGTDFVLEPANGQPAGIKVCTAFRVLVPGVVIAVRTAGVMSARRAQELNNGSDRWPVRQWDAVGKRDG